MKKYRARRLAGEHVWKIEELDTEFQIASIISKLTFVDKFSAEFYIRDVFVKNHIWKDAGDYGGWIDGTF